MDGDSITIQLPDLGPKVSKLLADDADVAICETAPVCKTEMALLSWCLGQALEKEGKHVFSAKSITGYRDRIAHWVSLAVSGKFFEVGKMRITFPRTGLLGSQIMFIKHDELHKHTAHKINSVTLIDAHDLKEDPMLWLAQHVTGKIRICGQVASPTHWFYRMCRSIGAKKSKRQIILQEGNDLTVAGVTYHQITSDDALKAGVITQRELDKHKACIPPILFNQLYMCAHEAETDNIVSEMSLRRFANTRLFIRDKGGKVIPFVFNPLQQTFLAMRRLAAMQGKPRKYLLLKYRRGGFTTLMQAENYKMCVTQPNSQCVTLAHTTESTKRIFRIAQLYHEKDPKALALKGAHSGQKLEIDQLNSLFFIGTAGSTGFGRGDTLQRVHGSEVSKWCPGPRQIEVVADLIAGLTEAASHGEVVLETTANGNEWFAQTYKDAKKKQNDWVPIFVPWFMDPTNTSPMSDTAEVADTLTDEEKDLILRHRLSFGQVLWRRQKKLALGKLFKQEYPEDDETCFLTSGICFFESELVLSMLEACPEHKKREIRIDGGAGYECIYEEPIVGQKYVIGCDTSEGLSNEKCDPNGFGVLKKHNGEQVAWVHGRFKPHVLAELCVQMSKKYNNALLGVERNNHGHAVLQKIIDLGYGKAHDRGGALYYYKPGRAGWDTNVQTRPIMLDNLAEAVNGRFMSIHDRDFLSEALYFKLQSDGSWAADPGMHDDTVFKWAIAWQMREVRLNRPDVIISTESIK